MDVYDYLYNYSYSNTSTLYPTDIPYTSTADYEHSKTEHKNMEKRSVEEIFLGCYYTQTAESYGNRGRQNTLETHSL